MTAQDELASARASDDYQRALKLGIQWQVSSGVKEKFARAMIAGILDHYWKTSVKTGEGTWATMRQWIMSLFIMEPKPVTLFYPAFKV